MHVGEELNEAVLTLQLESKAEIETSPSTHHHPHRIQAGGPRRGRHEDRPFQIAEQSLQGDSCKLLEGRQTSIELRHLPFRTHLHQVFDHRNELGELHPGSRRRDRLTRRKWRRSEGLIFRGNQAHEAIASVDPKEILAADSFRRPIDPHCESLELVQSHRIDHLSGARLTFCGGHHRTERHRHIPDRLRLVEELNRTSTDRRFRLLIEGLCSQSNRPCFASREIVLETRPVESDDEAIFISADEEAETIRLHALHLITVELERVPRHPLIAGGGKIEDLSVQRRDLIGPSELDHQVRHWNRHRRVHVQPEGDHHPSRHLSAKSTAILWDELRYHRDRLFDHCRVEITRLWPAGNLLLDGSLHHLFCPFSDVIQNTSDFGICDELTKVRSLHLIRGLAPVGTRDHQEGVSFEMHFSCGEGRSRTENQGNGQNKGESRQRTRHRHQFHVFLSESASL